MRRPGGARSRAAEAAALVALLASAACGPLAGPGDTAATQPATQPATAAPGTGPAAAPVRSPGTPGSAQPVAPPPPAAGTALAALAELPVKGRAPRTGYDRALFGGTWADVDGDGCDTRQDVLRRDLSGVVPASGCPVRSGTASPEPYTGREVAFRAGASTLDVDHVVALGDAWQTGAQQWDAARRRALADDPLELLLVDASANRQKGDGDAATWLPPARGYRCAYVARQVAVKRAYGLWVTPAERDAVARVLATCPGEPLPAGPGQPPAAPAPARSSPPATTTTTTYASCADACAAGVAPLHVGDPGYRRGLDRDGDGVACE